MKEIIVLLAEIVNNLHDVINYMINHVLKWDMSDKDLHFWIMGIIGFTAFLIVWSISRFIAKLPFGIAILSFLYTFTFMVVLVFAIEIQQAITNRGRMEFADAVIGLWGFLVFFFIFAGAALSIYFIRKYILEQKKKERYKQTSRSRFYS